MKGAIFDLDGTLIDSMFVWDKIDNTLLESYGYSPDEEYLETITKLTFSEGANYIISRYSLDCTQQELLKRIDELALSEYSNNIKLKNGALIYLEKLKNKDIPLSIATSCTKKLSQAVLKKNGIYSYFDEIVYSNDIANGKRSPEIFKHTAKTMKLESSECWVFEDSVFAGKNAKKAGCYLVGVYDEYSKKSMAELKNISDKFILDFNELL